MEGKPNEGNFLRGIALIAASLDNVVDKGEGGVIPSHNTEDYFGEVERGGGADRDKERERQKDQQRPANHVVQGVPPLPTPVVSIVE